MVFIELDVSWNVIEVFGVRRNIRFSRVNETIGLVMFASRALGGMGIRLKRQGRRSSEGSHEDEGKKRKEVHFETD